MMQWFLPDRWISVCGRILSAVIVVALGACSSPSLKEVPPGGVILAFGDSLTVGVGTTIEHSYPSVLARLSGRTVINAGVSGETTGKGRVRFEKLVEDSQPDLIILLEGGNDIIRNHRADEIRANLSAMITFARQADIELVLIGVPEKKLFSESAPLYQELAEQHGVLLNEDLLSSLLLKIRYKSDAIHLNRDGYQAMAEAIYAWLDDNGAF
jgi:acyl-CoA thioesterase I